MEKTKGPSSPSGMHTNPDPRFQLEACGPKWFIRDTVTGQTMTFWGIGNQSYSKPTAKAIAASWERVAIKIATIIRDWDTDQTVINGVGRGLERIWIANK